jgi:hypothetical protein
LSSVRRSGISRIVRTFGVTSSPVRPSPRVAPRISRPFSYVRLIARPSTLSSQMNCTGPPASRSVRSAQAASSASSNTLSSDIIRSACSTGVNWVENVPPTFCVGESGVRSAGNSSSIASSSRSLWSNSASEIVGASST